MHAVLYTNVTYRKGTQKVLLFSKVCIAMTDVFCRPGRFDLLDRIAGCAL